MADSKRSKRKKLRSTPKHLIVKKDDHPMIADLKRSARAGLKILEQHGKEMLKAISEDRRLHPEKWHHGS